MEGKGQHAQFKPLNPIATWDTWGATNGPPAKHFWVLSEGGGQCPQLPPMLMRSGKDPAEHAHHARQVLAALEAHGLKVHPQKSVFRWCGDAAMRRSMWRRRRSDGASRSVSRVATMSWQMWPAVVWKASSDALYPR